MNVKFVSQPTMREATVPARTWLCLTIIAGFLLLATACTAGADAAPVPPPNPPTVAMDDSGMSRIRLVSLVASGPDVDLHMDGQIATLGSDERELTQVPAGFMTGFLYIEPGAHTAAIVPSGETAEDALISVDLTLEAGHRYTVAVTGQNGNSTFIPLVIDETTAIAQARTSPEQDIMLLINNLTGADTIDFLEDGSGPANVPYGGFVAAPIQAGHVDHLLATVNGDQTLEDWGDFHELPAVDFIHSYNGSFPGNFDSSMFVFDSGFSSDLNAHDLLAQLTDYAIPWSGHTLSFGTFLSAMQAAGLGDVLTTGTYLILVPTDAAFDAASEEELAALMADPAALNAYLRNYIIEGYYPYGALSGSEYGTADRTFTNLQGADVQLKGTISVNDVSMADLPNPTAAHGTRIVPLSRVFLSLSEDN